jgi:hypothetical protein
VGPRPGRNDRFNVSYVTLASAADAAEAVLRFDNTPCDGGVIRFKLAPLQGKYPAVKILLDGLEENFASQG